MDNIFDSDLAQIPKELSLLLEILKTDEDNIQIPISMNEIDWGKFLHLALHHRVYSLIYSKLKKLDKEWIPSYVIRILRQEYKENTFRMLLLTGEMEQISKLFTENKIPLLYLKGPVIAADLYGDISLRTSRDLDVLIPITDLKRVDELLLNFGYEREKRASFLNEWKYRDHHVTYIHPQKNIHLEIHWRLQRRPSMEPNFFELWERKRLSKLTTYPVYFLGEEDLFLFLISHGARHGWFRLRWLLDIDRNLRKGINIEKINLLLKDYHNHNMLGQAIILASQLLDTPIIGDMQIFTERNGSKKLARKALYFVKGTESLEEIMSTKDYKRYLYSLKSNKQKFLSILILFYPSKVDEKTLKLPKLLHFLYFPLRPLLWVWRKIVGKFSKKWNENNTTTKIT
ncbi:nucleotidyltransferase family protein [Peribacillus simplex]|uniref:Renal dipeptidase n=1 Tax=Peribacillus simplex NBRC 15720 = DSM 1321 TaxID=1349754 RepID=A0A223ELF4_9BACI|nr:nucleotidyltransferase family protein [Peribacillus simplex]ASS96099.1 Renal dipeptidase [Peribacillus simplex NBRC 15720 = DSM 1321]MEC1397198.1 nucleotidyltransferase family protein [Peribacillus simplex]